MDYLIGLFLQKLIAVCNENNIKLTEDLFVIILDLFISELVGDETDII